MPRAGASSYWLLRASSEHRGPTYSDFASISARSLRMAAASSRCAATRCTSGLGASAGAGLSSTFLGEALRLVRLTTLGAIRAFDTLLVPQLGQDSWPRLA